MKTIWVKILLISATILIPVSIALRVIYGSRWLEWENRFIESCGINAMAYTFAKVSIFLFLGGFWVWRERERKRRQNKEAYELPKT
jgi:hypothetical protein